METEQLLRELAHGPVLEPFRVLVEPLEEHDRERRSEPVASRRFHSAGRGNASEAADRVF